MNARVLCISIAVVALCLMGTAAPALQLVLDNFDANAVAAGAPTGWTFFASGTVDKATSAIVEVVPGSGDRQLKLSDPNGNNLNMGQIHKVFAAVTATSGGGTGEVTAQADIAFAQNTAVFMVTLGNGAPGTANLQAARIQFEGNITWGTGGGPGRLDWMKNLSGTANVFELFQNPDPLHPGEPNYTGGLDSSTPPQPTPWYTIKIVANVNTKTFHVFLGPKGGTLEDIDQYAPSATVPDTGLPFYKDGSGNQLSQLSTLGFMTSNKKVEPAGDMYVDNVSVVGDVDVTDCATVAAAKNTAIGKLVRLTDKIVTAGTDQLAGGFCYVQDDTAGIRVRPGATVHQGDKVTIVGTLIRDAEDGTSVKRVGEKEIGNLLQLAIASGGPYALPKLVVMTNKTVGGGNFGPIEADTYVAQPGAYKGDGDMGVPLATRLQTPADGLCNIGRYVRVCGRVLYSDRQRNPSTGSYFFYIDDGSGVLDGTHFPVDSVVQKGIRVYCKNLGARLDSIEGQYALVTGIVAGIAVNDSVIRWSGSSDWQYCNARVIRPVEETFTDTNANGVWDPAEPFLDSNGNGVWDGMIFLP